jgi:hypothetical protein
LPLIMDRRPVRQQPGDRELLREAAADLYSFGPDWDGHAQRLRDAADGIG